MPKRIENIYKVPANEEQPFPACLRGIRRYIQQTEDYYMVGRFDQSRQNLEAIIGYYEPALKFIKEKIEDE